MKWLSVSLMLCGVHQWTQLLLGAWDSPKQIVTALEGHFLYPEDIEQLFHIKGTLTGIGRALLLWETLTLLMFVVYVSHWSTRLLFCLGATGLAYMAHLGLKHKGTPAGEYISRQGHVAAGFLFLEVGLLSWFRGV